VSVKTLSGGFLQSISSPQGIRRESVYERVRKELEDDRNENIPSVNNFDGFTSSFIKDHSDRIDRMEDIRKVVLEFSKRAYQVRSITGESFNREFSILKSDAIRMLGMQEESLDSFYQEHQLSDPKKISYLVFRVLRGFLEEFDQLLSEVEPFPLKRVIHLENVYEELDRLEKEIGCLETFPRSSTNAPCSSPYTLIVPGEITLPACSKSEEGSAKDKEVSERS